MERTAEQVENKFTNAASEKPLNIGDRSSLGALLSTKGIRDVFMVKELSRTTKDWGQWSRRVCIADLSIPRADSALRIAGDLRSIANKQNAYDSKQRVKRELQKL